MSERKTLSKILREHARDLMTAYVETRNIQYYKEAEAKMLAAIGIEQKARA